MKRKSDRISLRSRRHSLHGRLHRRRHMRQLVHSKIRTRHHPRSSLHDFLRLQTQSRHRRRSRRPSAPRLSSSRASRRSDARRRGGRRRGGDENALLVALALRVVAQTQLLRVREHDRLLQPASHSSLSSLRREIVRKHQRRHRAARVLPHKTLFELRQLLPELLRDCRQENRLEPALELALILLFLVLHFQLGACELLVFEIAPGLDGTAGKSVRCRRLRCCGIE